MDYRRNNMRCLYRGQCNRTQPDFFSTNQNQENVDTTQEEGVKSVGKSLAMIYSPYQIFQDLYEPEEGLRRGTIFQELDKPFAGARRGCK